MKYFCTGELWRPLPVGWFIEADTEHEAKVAFIASVAKQFNCNEHDVRQHLYITGAKAQETIKLS